MLLLDVKTDNVTDYKKTSMLIAFPTCSGKCNNCQNQYLLDRKNETVLSNAEHIVDFYNNLLTHDAIVMAGLEPFDSFMDVLSIVNELGNSVKHDVDIVIYTGYDQGEYIDNFERNLVDTFKHAVESNNHIKSLIVKIGRYDEDYSIEDGWFNKSLGVNLATTNQFTLTYNPDGTGYIERYNKKER